MKGKYNGAAAKFKELGSCKTMINIQCICHRLALACADTGDALKFIQEFEKTMLDLWTFFTNSPKRLKTDIKTTLKARNFDQMSKKEISAQRQESCKNKMAKFASTCRFSLPRICWTNPYSSKYKRSTIRPSCKRAPKKNRFSRVSRNTISFEVYAATSVLFKSNISVR